MAAKKKKVSVQVDVETLERLAEAAAVSDLASAIIVGADDPELRERLVKKSGKKPGKRK